MPYLDPNPLILGSRAQIRTNIYIFVFFFFIYIINTFQGYDALDHNKFIYIRVCVRGVCERGTLNIYNSIIHLFIFY